ncbi:MAG: hypothetical protein NUV54_03055 [Candidatus Taylorbacteria bacterium]|nr:hypothetical protein [Candidatus Taylorbacteria bacterium]
MQDSVHFINNEYFYRKLYELLSGQYFPSWGEVYAFLLAMLDFIRPLSVILSLLFLTGIIYCTIRIRTILHEQEEEHLAHSGAHEAHGATHESAHSAQQPEGNQRWQKIAEHINSHHSGDWRLAILECDIILDEMLTKMGYHGETLSDRLKGVEKSDFLTIDKAWEAHRVRNVIAHEGSNFEISEREAKRIVSLYEEVFKEFKFI